MSAGILTVVQKTGDYNPELASWETYLTPHVTGAMRREMERLMGFACLPKRLLYQKAEGQAPKRLRPIFAEELTGKIKEETASLQLSVEQQVYVKIGVEYLRKGFDDLSYKEKEILGGCYGVFGYAKQTLEEIGEAFTLTEDGVAKARNAALKKLREICMDGDLGVWREVHTIIREATGV